MSIQRIGGGYTPPDLSQETEAAQQKNASASPHHRHHALTGQKRPSHRKRRSAESPDANDTAAESEELLMMLEQHLRREGTGVLKVDTRDSRGSQQGFDQDEHPTGGQAGGNRSSADSQQNLPARALPMHLAMRKARDESVLSRHWHTAASGAIDGAKQSAAGLAETAFLAVLEPRARRAAALAANPASRTTGQPRAGSSANTLLRIDASKPANDEAMHARTTYQVLAIMREFMRMPDNARKSRTTLAQVRDRIVSATTTTPGARAAGAPGAARRPLSPAEESMNLLLPIALLNLGRSRTRAGRAMGMSALAALIRRGRGW